MTVPPPPTNKPFPISLIFTLSTLSAVGPLAIDAYLAAMPTITQDLGTTATRTQLTLTAFMLGMAVGQLVIGPLSDIIGRVRPLYISVLISLAATVACIFVPNVQLFITARFVMGAAAASGMVISRAIVADSTVGLQTAKLMGIMMMINSFAPVIAPLLGGIILEFATWRTIFAVIAAFMAVSTICVYTFVRETLPVEKRRTGGLATTYRGIGEVLRIPRFRGYMLTMTLAFGSIFAYVSGSTYVLQNVLGLSSLHYTWVFGINSMGIVAMSSLATYLVGRVAIRRTLSIGVFLMFTAAVLITITFLAGITLVPTLIFFFMTTCAMGLIAGNASSLALMEGRHVAGSASAVLGTVQALMGGIATPLTALGGGNAVLPMAFTMLGFASLSLIAFLTTPKAEADYATGTKR